jgi:amino acid permease
MVTDESGDGENVTQTTPLDSNSTETELLPIQNSGISGFERGLKARHIQLIAIWAVIR